MEEYTEEIIITLFYIIWPLAIIACLFIASKQKNKEGSLLMTKAFFAWLAMLILAVFGIYYNDSHYVFWGVLSFVPTLIAILYSVLGVVTLLANEKMKVNNHITRH